MSKTCSWILGNTPWRTGSDAFFVCSKCATYRTNHRTQREHYGAPLDAIHSDAMLSSQWAIQERVAPQLGEDSTAAEIRLNSGPGAHTRLCVSVCVVTDVGTCVLVYQPVSDPATKQWFHPNYSYKETPKNAMLHTSAHWSLRKLRKLLCSGCQGRCFVHLNAVSGAFPS